MPTAADQVPRLLAMSAWLATVEETTLAEVAERFGITPARARADIGLLAVSEIPGQLGFYLLDVDFDALDEDGTVRASRGFAPDQPARFSADETMTLLVGLRTLAETAPADSRDAIESARRKIAAAAAEHATAAGAIWLNVASASPQVRETIAASQRSRRRLRLIYVDARGQESLRRVDPGTTRVVDGYHYLDAYDLDRQDWRSFRMDRISHASLTTEACDEHPPPPASAPDWAQSLARAPQVRLLVRQGARWIMEYYPTTSVTDLGNGEWEVSLGVGSPDWLTALLLRCGGDVTVLDPPGAGDGARAIAQRTVAMYFA